MRKLFTSLFALTCVYSAHAIDIEISGWGTNKSVAEAWNRAAKYTSTGVEIDGEMVETGYCVADDKSECSGKTGHYACGTVDSDGCTYNKTEMVNRRDYQLDLATDTLFTQVLADMEREAQAKYNAKLTAEQNMCVGANKGGIMGRNDMTGTYRWVKLKKNKVPKEYATKGLDTGDITASNDLYGSFCAARVTIQSDDTSIQEAIRNGSSWATRYFAVGDVFTCGSWIPQSDLEKIAEGIAEKKYGTKNDAKKLTTSQKWWLAGATVLGTGIGGVGADLLQTNGVNKFLGAGATPSEDDLEIITNSLAKAKTAFLDSTDGCNNSSEESTNRIKVGSVVYVQKEGLMVYKDIQANGSNTNSNFTCSELDAYITKLEKKVPSNNNWWQRGGRRGTIDTVAAAGTGLLSFFATRDTMEARNAEEWDADTQAAVNEFMANVGNHIYCFIGAEEAGTFGDVVVKVLLRLSRVR